MNSTRAFLGLLLVALGGLFLAGEAGVLDAGEVIGDWWPVIIIVVGAGQLLERRHAPVGPLIVISVGLVLLATQLDVLGDNVWRLVWPLILIAIGLSLVLRRSGDSVAGTPDELIRIAVAFSGSEVRSTAQNFKGGSITAVSGGAHLDLRQARLDPAGASLSVFALFGEADVIVPRGWRLEAKGLPLFGGFDNKADAPAEAGAPTLRIDATAIFGGVEVKHDK